MAQHLDPSTGLYHADPLWKRYQPPDWESGVGLQPDPNAQPMGDLPSDLNSSQPSMSDSLPSLALRGLKKGWDAIKPSSGQAEDVSATLPNFPPSPRQSVGAPFSNQTEPTFIYPSEAINGPNLQADPAAATTAPKPDKNDPAVIKASMKGLYKADPSMMAGTLQPHSFANNPPPDVQAEALRHPTNRVPNRNQARVDYLGRLLGLPSSDTNGSVSQNDIEDVYKSKLLEDQSGFREKMALAGEPQRVRGEEDIKLEPYRSDAALKLRQFEATQQAAHDASVNSGNLAVAKEKGAEYHDRTTAATLRATAQETGKNYRAALAQNDKRGAIALKAIMDEENRLGEGLDTGKLQDSPALQKHLQQLDADKAKYVNPSSQGAAEPASFSTFLQQHSDKNLSRALADTKQQNSDGPYGGFETAQELQEFTDQLRKQGFK